MTPDEKKQHEELQKMKLERVKALGGLCVAGCSAIGVVGTFLYCFFVIGFLPVGLTVSDTLFFVFVTLAFGCWGAALAVFGSLAYVPYALKKSPTGTTVFTLDVDSMGLLVLFVIAMAGVSSAYLAMAPVPFGGWGWLIVYLAVVILHGYAIRAFAMDCMESWLCMVLFLVFSGVLGGSAGANSHSCIPLAACVVIVLSGLFLASGLSNLMVPTAPSPATSSSSGTTAPVAAVDRAAVFFIVAAFLLPYVAAVTGPGIFNAVMSKLGLRSESATVIVTEANFQVMQAVADMKGMPLYVCKANGDGYAVSNIRVLWHGMGQRSYVELYSQPAQHAGGEGRVRVELDSAGIKKSQAPTTASCIELRRGIYFDSNQPSLSDAQWKRSRPFIQDFIRTVGADSKTVAIGYTDPMRPSTDSNFALAQARACHVVDRLVREGLAAAEDSWIDVRLDGIATTDCKDVKGAEDLRSCFEKNRRVELQLVSTDDEFSRVGTAKATIACSGMAQAANIREKTMCVTVPEPVWTGFSGFAAMIGRQPGSSVCPIPQ